ncbi:ROK family protein [Kitasatospora sp. NPDC049258]|uniref:ROK family protein n=1 Tax=Kitasatospora sp. NPDC049258 TaxID=3155394 RepID=UPI00341DE4F1
MPVPRTAGASCSSPWSTRPWTRHLTTAGRRADQLWAVGVGTPGIVDESTGQALRTAGIAHWAPLPVAANLRDRLRCPVLLDNDVTLAVLAERESPAGHTDENLVLVRWAERIGAGIVIAGPLYRGSATRPPANWASWTSWPGRPPSASKDRAPSNESSAHRPSAGSPARRRGVPAYRRTGGQV